MSIQVLKKENEMEKNTKSITTDVVNAKDDSSFEYSGAGDRFSLLLYRGKIKPLRAYNNKIYKYCD